MHTALRIFTKNIDNLDHRTRLATKYFLNVPYNVKIFEPIARLLNKSRYSNGIISFPPSSNADEVSKIYPHRVSIRTYSTFHNFIVSCSPRNNREEASFY